MISVPGIFLRSCAGAVHAHASVLRKEIVVIAESDLNDVRILNPVEICGYGLDAQWNDDFHHSLHALLTNENKGYYEDFGEVWHLEKAFREGFVYSGGYSRFRKRRHGNSSSERPTYQFIVFSQSHDQVGNRIAGDRLSFDPVIRKTQSSRQGLLSFRPFYPYYLWVKNMAKSLPFSISQATPTTTSFRL